MRLKRSTALEAPTDRVWKEVVRTRLLTYVAHPMQVFVPVNPSQWPEEWASGEYEVRLWTFGILPMGSHTIAISYPGGIDGPQSHILLDDGRGWLIRRWRHLITVTPLADGRCDYRDEIDIEAGLLTPAVYLFAQLFYWHRQRRWRRLVMSGFEYPHGW